MTVQELSESMSYEEFQKWLSYFERKPVDWRDDDRTFKFLQTQGVKGKPWEYFPTLAPIYNRSSGNTDPMSSFKNSLMFQKIATATGGDRIPI